MIKRQGFTLVEVLVALAVFAVGASALLSAQANQARMAAGLEQRLFAQIVAENELLLSLNGPPPPLGVTRGEVDMAGYRFQWQRATAETGVADVRRVELTVSDLEGGPLLAQLTGLLAAQ